MNNPSISAKVTSPRSGRTRYATNVSMPKSLNGKNSRKGRMSKKDGEEFCRKHLNLSARRGQSKIAVDDDDYYQDCCGEPMELHYEESMSDFRYEGELESVLESFQSRQHRVHDLFNEDQDAWEDLTEYVNSSPDGLPQEGESTEEESAAETNVSVSERYQKDMDKESKSWDIFSDKAIERSNAPFADRCPLCQSPCSREIPVIFLHGNSLVLK